MIILSRNSGPHPLCVGKCKEFEADKPKEEKRCELGQKRCQMCNQCVFYEGVWCSCCNFVLRTRLRNTKNRHQLQLIYASKRI